MDWRKMSGEMDTGFVNRVYGIVAEIPRGKVATYGQIAEMNFQTHSGTRLRFWRAEKAACNAGRGRHYISAEWPD